jgi:hypothetical protein
MEAFWGEIMMRVLPGQLLTKNGNERDAFQCLDQSEPQLAALNHLGHRFGRRASDVPAQPRSRMAAARRHRNEGHASLIGASLAGIAIRIEPSRHSNSSNGAGGLIR